MISEGADREAWLYHHGTVGAANGSDEKGRLDSCVRCCVRNGLFDGTGADDECCVGLENWLDKSGGCPICRTPWPPPGN